MEVTERLRGEPVRQFSIMTDNKVGRLHDFLSFLGQRSIHALALSLLDTTDSTIVRLIPDDPDATRQELRAHGFSFSESEVVAVEIPSEEDLRQVTSALVEAEINIHYLYGFICRPNGRPVLALRLEDSDLGAMVLRGRGIRILLQNDLAR